MDNVRGKLVPIIYCWHCGKQMSDGIDYNARQYCAGCKPLHNAEMQKLVDQSVVIKSQLMYWRALDLLQKQWVPMHEYYKAAQVVKQRIDEKPKTFNSAPEIMACLELLRQRVRIKLQVKISDFKVDFVLRDELIVLEIDGYLHAFQRTQDWYRDEAIRKKLGAEWEVIRIPVKCIEGKVRALYDGIVQLRTEQQRVRAENHGLLPDSYSIRTMEVWANAVRKLA
ncbi:MAG: DUF559 domain-containing protein [Kiritimatiellia bacterium]